MSQLFTLESRLTSSHFKGKKAIYHQQLLFHEPSQFSLSHFLLQIVLNSLMKCRLIWKRDSNRLPSTSSAQFQIMIQKKLSNNKSMREKIRNEEKLID
jgi:hypothetical protein